MSIYGKDYWGFVYIWHDRKRNKFCIGSHFGALDSGYVTSTGDMKWAYKKRPEDFKRRILYFLPENNLDILRAKEQEWLNLISEEELGRRYYNLKKAAHGWEKGRARSPETKAKISATMKGRKKPTGFNIGRKHSPETLAKMRATAKDRDMSHLRYERSPEEREVMRRAALRREEKKRMARTLSQLEKMVHKPSCSPQ